MKRRVLLFIFASALLLVANVSVAQRTIKGYLIDSDTKETLVGAAVVIKGTTNGTVTNYDGSFSVVVEGAKTLVMSYIGFDSKEMAVDATITDLGKIALKSSSVGLSEISVIASVAVDRKTPVAVSKIDPILIQERLGTQEFPEILKSTPSVYATKQGGGFGDSRVNVRGFNSRNIAVMINGVPVNDMENGWVYWSNWAGLADVTRSMQVQRGLGASKIATPAVGGSINILTTTTDAKKSGSVFATYGDNNSQKLGFTLSTGLNEKGWAITASGSKSTGDGFVDATSYVSYAYFLNISKRINDEHSLAFTVFGAPQTHGQRSFKMTIANYDKFGLKYNDRWGYKKGQVLNSAMNYYHKPQAILNHFWTISEKTSLSTALYASIGTGGGTGTYGSFPSYRREGLIDFDKIVDENVLNGDLGSKAILRSSRNDHEWYGVLSNFSTQLTDELNLTVGVDLRKYVGKHFREVTDLLGGEYFIDSYTGSNGDINNPYKTVKVGDKIGYDNDGKINWYGGFTQLEYNLNDLSTFVSGAYSYTTMQRIDYFKYKPENQESEVISFPSYSVKGGANYNINASLNVFANAGYFSRYPDFNVAFPNNANVANDKAQNEKTLSFELGAGFRSDVFSANLNIYHTQWMDKNYVRRFTSGTPVVEYFANISGLDARHQGVELDFVYKPIKSVEVTGMVSLGDWTWTNNVQRVLIYDDASKLIGTTNVFVKGLHVGDAAQKTAALGVSCELMKGLKAGIDWNYYRDLYADFDPTVRSVYDNQAIDYPDSWKLPNYSLLDMFVRYNFEMGGLDATFSGKVNNLLDVEYITEASDGSSNNWDSAQVFYGVGRTWSMSMKIKF